MADSACPAHVDAMTDGMHPVFLVTCAECDICTLEREE